MRGALGLILCLGVALAAPATAQPLTKLAVSYSATSDFLPAFIAKDTGIFERDGLDVTLTNLATTALGPPALQAGSLQIAAISPPLLLLANDGGLDLVAVCNMAYLDKSDPHSSLVTRVGLSVTEARDLIGKKVGRPGVNSAIDMLLKKWLLDRGVAPGEVTIVETPFPRMADLLKAGQIDAAVALEPFLSRIVTSGVGVKSIDFISEVSPRIDAAIWGATRAWASANIDSVRAFRSALAAGLVYMREHPDAADAIEKRYLGSVGTPASLALDIAPADFDLWIGIEKQLKLLQQAPPDAAKLILN